MAGEWFLPRNHRGTTADILTHKRTFQALRRALGDDVDDLKRHHYFAGLIDYLDERGVRPGCPWLEDL